MGETTDPGNGKISETITLDGRAWTMRPSLELAKFTSRGPNGLRGAIIRCGNCDLDTVTDCVLLAIKYEIGEKLVTREHCMQVIYEAGLHDIAEKMITILESLVHGGRPTPKEPAEGAGGDGPLAPSA